jgi:type IV pilus assembly protein PilC
MFTFAYTARDSAGRASNGTMSADNAADVRQKLRAEGKYPTDIHPVDGGPVKAVATGGGGIKITRAELITISQQLSVMIETGVTVSEALDCIGAQADRPAVRNLVADVSKQIQDGSSFSAAIGRHPKSFPRLYVALMQAAERSGMLGRLLTRATTYLRDEQEIVRRVRGACIYPGFMVTFAITTTVFLLAFVLPKFTAIYASKSAALPLPTKILMNLSSFIVNYKYGLAAGLVITALTVWFYVRTEGGARMWHYVQLQIPLLGGMFRKMHLSRGLRMIGTMAGAGVSLVDCVKTAHDLCSNGYYRDLWTGVGQQIQAGKQFSDPLFASSLVPRSVSQMLKSAEKGGKLAVVLEQVAGYSEQELKEKIAEVTRYIEPIMIMVMGLIIGGVSLALLMPIFSISKVMAH